MKFITFLQQEGKIVNQISFDIDSVVAATVMGTTAPVKVTLTCGTEILIEDAGAMDKVKEFIAEHS